MAETADNEHALHWADQAASRILETGRPPVVSTGISPSGEIHIGNMREVVTGDAVFRALRDRGVTARFNYVADNFDPLRKVYPFLDPAVYSEFVGRPLSEIPCPCGRHPSYADHFLEPFLEALAELHIGAEIERADQMYKSGRMTPFIIGALESRERIASILTELTGKEVPEHWSPFNPLCAACGRIDQARVVAFSAADETVDASCACGERRVVPMAGGGKLVWRIDWPARWMMLGVTVEPFGKDHATRGGSYDTGDRVIREVFGGEPPFPIPYEWIRLKGRGDMSSSKGNVLSIARILEVAPPEALRYLIIRDRPQRPITFDPAVPLLQLVDELDDHASKGRNPRAVELSEAAGFEPVGVPYKHLVVVAQLARFDPDEVIRILHRTGYPDARRDAVAGRMRYALKWLEGYAPEDLKFTVRETLPPEAAALDEAQRRFLGRLAKSLRPDLAADDAHSMIWELARETGDTKPAHLFEAIYVSLLGKRRGPRAGAFIAFLGSEFCAARFAEAAGGIE